MFCLGGWLSSSKCTPPLAVAFSSPRPSGLPKANTICRVGNEPTMTGYLQLRCMTLMVTADNWTALFKVIRKECQCSTSSHTMTGDLEFHCIVSKFGHGPGPVPPLFEGWLCWVSSKNDSVAGREVASRCYHMTWMRHHTLSVFSIQPSQQVTLSHISSLTAQANHRPCTKLSCNAHP